MKQINRYFFVAWVLVLLSTSLLYFQIKLNSDTLFYHELFTDLFHYGGHLSDWSFNADPDYFPDVFLYFIAFLLFSTPTACLFFVTFIQAILVALCSIWLAKKIYPTLSNYAKTLILAMVAFISLAAANSHMELYYNVSNTHLSSFLCTFLSLGLLLTYLNNGKSRKLLLLLCTATIGILNDAVFLISFYATALLLLSTLWLSIFFNSSLQHYKERFLKSMVVLLIALPVEQFLRFIIPCKDSFSTRINITSYNISASFSRLIQATLNLFIPFNIFIFLLTFFVIFSLIYCLSLFFRQIHCDKNSTKHPFFSVNVSLKPLSHDAFTFSAIFLAMLIPINIVGVILSGGAADIWCYRYLMFPIALLLLLTLIHFDRSGLFIFKEKKPTILAGVLIGLAVGIAFTAIKNLWPTSTHFSFADGLESERYTKPIITCINDINQNKMPLHSGLSLDFWYARGVAMQLPQKTYINYMAPLPYFPMSNIGAYLRPKHYHINYNFIIVPPDRNKNYINVWQNMLVNHRELYSLAQHYFPAGYQRFNCAHTPFQVWVYPDARLNDFLKLSISRALFMEGKQNHTTWLASELGSALGKKTGTTRIATPDSGPGYLVYGPFFGVREGWITARALKPGKYRFTIRYQAQNEKKSTVMSRWFIGHFSYPVNAVKPEQVIDEGILLPQSNGQVTRELTIPRFRKFPVEILIWYSGQGSLTVKQIEIERLSS